jgi:alpha-tubulin suppressor-like RCC1 family protein
VAVSYQWFKNGLELGGAVTATLDGSLHFDRGDTLSCAVTPHDGSEPGTTVASLAVTIINSAPTLASASLGAGPYRTNDTLTCTPSGFQDADGDPEGYRYRWFVGGAPVDGQDTPMLPGTAFRRGDAVQCVVTPHDGSTSGLDVATHPVLIQNTPPTLASASIGTGPYGTNAVVPCTPSGFTDADDDAPVYRYAWFKNGVELAGQTASTLDGASHFDPGDSLRCRVTPTDGTDSGVPVDSNALTIGLPPESFTGVSIGTGPYFTNDILTAVATGPNGETYNPAAFKYQWYRDGVAIAGATSATLNGATHFSKGNTLACAMTAFNGTQTGPTFTSNTVTIQNSAPVLTSASLKEAPYYADSAFNCSATPARDPDGDPVTTTYEWYRNGAVEPGLTFWYLSGAPFRKGDSVACRVIAKDATLSASVTSNTVIIQNSPPRLWAAGLVLFAGTTASGQVRAYDPDGDPVGGYAIASGSAHGGVVFTDTTTGAFTFTAHAGYHGPANFTFTATDGTTPSAPMTAGVQVHDKRLSRGEQYGCAIAADRTLRCWGANTSGQLGNGTLLTPSGVPVQEALGLTDWASIATGAAGDYHEGRGHVCAIRLNGSLYCWGRNEHGQLGLGTVGGNVTRPTLVDAGKWIEVAVGYGHTCGLKQDGSLWCWGRNAEGEIGQGVFDGTYPSPTLVSAGNTYATLAAGDQHTCAITSQGALVCWGQGGRYALGNGTLPDRSRPTQEMTGATNWVQVDADNGRTFAVRADGTLWMWGETSGVRGAPYDAQPRQFDSGWREVSAGSRHFCGVKTTGALVCYGSNWYGALGVGLSDFLAAGIGPVDGAKDWVEVSSGYDGSCGRKSNGTTWCWGDNLHGQLAVGTDQFNLVPAPVGTATNWREVVLRKADVSTASSGACATRTDGTLWCSGYGYAGDGTGDRHPLFTQPQPVESTWASVGPGILHVCATRTNGSLWCWGDGGAVLAYGGPSGKSRPVQVGTALDWAQGKKDLGSGYRYSCVLKVDGALYCWGANGNGQLGLGDRVERTVPTRVGTSTWSSLAVGTLHACGIQTDGSLWCWGSNRFGQLGLHPGTPSNLPERCESSQEYAACGTSLVRMGSASDWTKVTAGGGHTCALNAAGTLFCWGRNHAGQLGSGVTGPQSCEVSYPLCNPEPVTVGGGFADVWAGTSHTCARKATGQLLCWGRNDVGQVGDGTVTNRLAPVELDGGSAGWLDVSVGDDFTCAVRAGAGGTRPLWCWGRSRDGAFGDGQGWKTAPVQTLLP